MLREAVRELLPCVFTLYFHTFARQVHRWVECCGDWVWNDPIPQFSPFFVSPVTAVSECELLLLPE